MKNINEMTREELIAALEAAPKPSSGGLKVSAKGAVSLYGVGRFPVTLYASQWDNVLNKADEIRRFIEANKSSLSYKEAQ